ncbi:hypothetical protein V8J88_23010 [Massilia sp. W12]|uniref:hypothetical protein n=1 Tax=Massilia sp. W12 TaxID=3126507 RepID=UPI0030D3FE97
MQRNIQSVTAFLWQAFNMLCHKITLATWRRARAQSSGQLIVAWLALIREAQWRCGAGFISWRQGHNRRALSPRASHTAVQPFVFCAMRAAADKAEQARLAAAEQAEAFEIARWKAIAQAAANGANKHARLLAIVEQNKAILDAW